MAATTPMTESTSFDTLSAANELREAGFDRKQAEALTRIVARAHGALATGAGLLRLEERVESRQAAFEVRIVRWLTAAVSIMLAAISLGFALTGFLIAG